MEAPLSPLIRPLSRVARWLADRRGVAAVEFAMILPVLMAFYLGMGELQPGFSIKRKLTLVSRTLADLTTRSATLSTNDLKDIFGASNTIMRPYDQSKLTQMVVTSVGITKNGSAYEGKVEWSCGWNLKLVPAGDDLKAKVKRTAVPVPTGFQTDGVDSFILVETLYPYTPTIGRTITGTLKLKDSSPWPVRDANRVAEPVCPIQT